MRREIFEKKLEKFVPVSDTVKVVFQEEFPQYKADIKEQGFNEFFYDLADGASSGDKKGLLELLELVWESGHNEGLLEGTTC